MILEPQEVQLGSKTIYKIVSTTPFYVLGIIPNTSEVIAISNESSPIIGSITSWMNGFGATTHQELLNEIANRGLTIQEGLI